MNFHLYSKHITRAHSFPWKISPNSAGQFAKFRDLPRQNHPNSAAYRGTFRLWANWALSCSKTSVTGDCHSA